MTEEKHEILHEMRVASPCPARWSDMTGDERRRLCHQCKTTVYNISEMSPNEVEELVSEQVGPLCVRLVRRADGTVITKDCPVGLRAVRDRVRLFYAAVVVAVIGAIGILSTKGSVQQAITHFYHSMRESHQSMPTFGLLEVPSRDRSTK